MTPQCFTELLKYRNLSQQKLNKKLSLKDNLVFVSECELSSEYALTTPKSLVARDVVFELNHLVGDRGTSGMEPLGDGGTTEELSAEDFINAIDGDGDQGHIFSRQTSQDHINYSGRTPRGKGTFIPRSQYQWGEQGIGPGGNVSQQEVSREEEDCLEPHQEE